MNNVEPLFGLGTPIIQAPMAGVQGSALAAAVSGSGALGSLPCAMLSVEQIATEIKAIQSATSGLFNINFFCHQSKPYLQQQADTWVNALQPHLEHFDIAPA